MTYDNTRQVVLSKVASDKPNAPDMRITFEFGGEKYQAPLWKWTKKDGTPVKDKNGNQLYKGDYAVDKWEPEGQQTQHPMATEADLDPDIPF